MIFFAATLYIDINAPNSMPKRSDPFEAPPYVDFIKAREGHYRVAGSYGVLMPNFASSVGLMDVHYVNSLISSEFHSFRTKYLHADSIVEEPVSSLWFTGRPERCAIVDGTDGGRGGYQPFYRPSEDDFLLALKGYSLLGVKYFITPSDLRLGRVFPLIYDEEVKIYRNPVVVDRAWVVRDLVVAKDALEAQAITFDPDFYPSRSAVVEEPGAVEFLKDIEKSGSSGESVVITGYEAARVEIEASLNRPGLVVLSDTFYPGWEVKVNGVALTPLRVDGLLRGVMLGEGESTVVWSYRPWSFRLGLLLCAASIVICIFLFFFLRRSGGTQLQDSTS